MKNKAIIFDASTLITLSMNGLFNEFKELKKLFGGKFIITNEVKYEIIDRPITIKRFELEALRLQEFYNEGVLESPSSLGVEDGIITQKAKEITSKANSTFRDNQKYIHIIDMGEASCLALGRILDEKGVENVLAIDERTMRMLIEKPENLKKMLKGKLRANIKGDRKNYSFFEGFRIIRSSELVYVAYKKKIVKLKGNKVLEALLYAVKFKGCSISDVEIDEIKKFG